MTHLSDLYLKNIKQLQELEAAIKLSGNDVMVKGKNVGTVTYNDSTRSLNFVDLKGDKHEFKDLKDLYTYIYKDTKMSESMENKVLFGLLSNLEEQNNKIKTETDLGSRNSFREDVNNVKKSVKESAPSSSIIYIEINYSINDDDLALPLISHLKKGAGAKSIVSHLGIEKLSVPVQNLNTEEKLEIFSAMSQGLDIKITS